MPVPKCKNIYIYDELPLSSTLFLMEIGISFPFHTPTLSPLLMRLVIRRGRR